MRTRPSRSVVRASPWASDHDGGLQARRSRPAWGRRQQSHFKGRGAKVVAIVALVQVCTLQDLYGPRAQVVGRFVGDGEGFEAVVQATHLNTVEQAEHGDGKGCTLL